MLLARLKIGCKINLIGLLQFALTFILISLFFKLAFLAQLNRATASAAMKQGWFYVSSKGAARRAKLKGMATATKMRVVNTAVGTGIVSTGIQMAVGDQSVRHSVETRYNKHLNPDYSPERFVMKGTKLCS
jgi:hypothetical protein